MIREEIIRKIKEKGIENLEVTIPILKNKLNCEEYLRFGFEIEALISESFIKLNMMKLDDSDYFNNKGFFGTGEMILYDDNEYGGVDNCIGGEVVTPILKDSEETWIDITKVCEYLNRYASLTDHCSVHINIGAEALGSDYKNWYNFLKIIAAFEPEIYKYMCNGEQIRDCAISGGFRNGFAMPIAENIREGLKKSDEENVSDINTLLNNCKFNGEFTYRKDKSISLKGIYIDNNRTLKEEELNENVYGRRIEFRMSNGTFSPQIIQNQIFLINRLIQISRNLTKEQEKVLDEIIKKVLPSNYNLILTPDRTIDCANFLFDNDNDKLQFIYTVLNLIKNQNELSDKVKVLELIKSGNMVLENLSNEFKNDKEIVLESVKIAGSQLKYASEELKNDKEVVLQAVKTYGRALEFASDELKNDRQVVIESVKNNGLSLKYASDELKNDKEIIMIAVDNNKEIAKYLNKEILLNHEFLLFLYKDNDVIKNYLLTEQIEEEAFVEYVKNDFIIYRYLLKQMLQGNKEIDNYILKILSEIKQKTVNKKEYETTIIDKYRTIALETFKASKIANNKKLMYGVLEIDPSLFEYLPQEDKDNKEIALKIIELNNIYFMYLNENLRADREVVYKSVKINGFSLEYVSDEFKNDRELVLEAVRQQGRFIEYASKELRGDKKLALESLKNDSYGFYYLSNELKNDLEIVKLALKNDITKFKELSAELRGNKELVLEVVKVRGCLIEYASDELKEDIEVAVVAIQNNENAFRYLAEKLRSNRELLLMVVKQNGELLQYASKELKNDKIVVLEAIKNRANALYYASDEIKADKEIIMIAVLKDIHTLRYASKELRNDKEVVLTAVRKDGYALEYASDELKNDLEVVLEAISKNKNNINYASKEMREKVKTLVLKR